MRLLFRLWSGILALFRQGAADEELDAELHAFLETAIDEKMRSGMGREEATRAARLETGLVSTHSGRSEDPRRRSTAGPSCEGSANYCTMNCTIGSAPGG